MTTKISVLGGGAMATGCSILLAEHPGQTAWLWTRNPNHARDIRLNRENRRLLPGVILPDTIEVTSDIQQAAEDADVLVIAIPTAFLRQALTEHAAALAGNSPIVTVVKGMENNTFRRPSEIIRELLPDRPIVALGGPSHAEEFARRLPASVVAACTDLTVAKQVQQIFSNDRFRVYTNQDIIGVELAGALKNIIAIAAGICDGLGFGDNAKSALMTRGLVEITRFGTALGAEVSTFSGLAGMGDLITTCVSPYGRNRSVGERLGRGESLQQILDSMEAVAEGVTTTRSIYEYSQQHNIETPITTEVYAVLFDGKSPLDATNSLMMRPHRTE